MSIHLKCLLFIFTRSFSFYCQFAFDRLSENNRPFEARVAIPRLTIRAKYTSSGVLIIIPASGSGDFDAVLDGVVADLKGQVSTADRDEKTYLHVDSLALELNVKKVRMHIAKVFKNNRILSKYSNPMHENWIGTNINSAIIYFCRIAAEATNLFLRENGIEVLKAMQPQLQKKLSSEFQGIANQLLKHVPREAFLVDWASNFVI